ncbi:MAG: ATPase, T2SS/T4P/T4SS family [Candidatus Wallbacteria bacterium]|nr:ATPase, T2SS/T4P/T4SS family [Candidatus Wallbacteria bacterium]
MAKNKKKLGDILVEAGLITQAELTKALSISRESNARLGKVLVEMGFVTDDKISLFLGEQFGFPFMKLSNVIVDPEAINLVPKSLVTKHKAVPIFKSGGKLTVAIADPLNIFAIDDFEAHTGLNVAVVLSSAAEIDETIEKYYGFQENAREIFRDYNVTPDAQRERNEIVDREIREITRLSSDTPVVKFVNLVLKEAIDNRSSDIHLENFENGLVVRFRIDGVLFEKMKPPVEMQKAIVSRIKILSGMDIGNSRIFQDGRFEMRQDDRQIDFRVSVMPGIYGENAVIRILDNSHRFVDLEKLGFSEELVKILKNVTQSPQGICLVTGPTGSGKTSTLYSLLKQVNSKERKVITLEDPVEYRFPYINQIQIDEKSGIDFSGGLRAILRHDPDIMMVGEMRDEETAKLAISAAMTGHMVFSTLHTNDAISSIQRLISLGVQPELIKSALKLVIAQRLVRCLCPYCRKDGPADAETREILKLSTMKVAVGCPKCSQSGYLGRTAVYEYLLFDSELRRMLEETKDLQQLRPQLIKRGFQPMLLEGYQIVKQGITTLAEIKKAVWEE